MTKPTITWRDKNERGRTRGPSLSIPGLRSLSARAPSSVLDTDWKPPPEYRSPSANNILRYWLETRQATSGQRPKYSPFTMRSRAELLIASLGYVRTLQVLTWMACPLSKYYQFPYGLRPVMEADVELSAAQSGAKLVEHHGYLGPLGLNNIGEERSK